MLTRSLRHPVVVAVVATVASVLLFSVGCGANQAEFQAMLDEVAPQVSTVELASGPPSPMGEQDEPGSQDGPLVTPLVATGAAIDVHMHLASQALADLYIGGGVPAPTADGLIALLDEANVRKGVVLAAGYFGLPDDSNMAPENDYVAAEVAKYPDRLIGFCGINPLYASAVSEIDRCLDLPGMVGVKLHLPGSGVDMTNEDHVAALSAVFDKAQERNAPLVIHVGDQAGLPLVTNGLANLGSIIEAHPEVRVLHAHCAGNMDDENIELWIRAGLADTAFVEGSACLKFYRDAPLAKRELMVWRFRKWGIERVLFGTDYLSFAPEETPKEALETLTMYPFTQEEIDTILANDGSAWIGQ
jgi:predicted TIM-barrel fold metal-dependent hydrolase